MNFLDEVRNNNKVHLADLAHFQFWPFISIWPSSLFSQIHAVYCLLTLDQTGPLCRGPA